MLCSDWAGMSVHEARENRAKEMDERGDEGEPCLSGGPRMAALHSCCCVAPCGNASHTPRFLPAQAPFYLTGSVAAGHAVPVYSGCVCGAVGDGSSCPSATSLI